MRGLFLVIFMVFSALTMAEPLAEPKPLAAIEVIDANGKSRHFSELEGQYHLVYFFASWCKPCFKSLHTVDQLRQSKPFRLSFTPVALDDDPEAVKQLMQKIGYSGDYWLAVQGSQPLQEHWLGKKYMGLPQLLLIDEKGDVQREIYSIKSRDDWERVLIASANELPIKTD